MNLVIRLGILIASLSVNASAIAEKELAPTEVVVTAKDLLPIKVWYQVLGRGMVKPYVLQVSETEAQLQRWNDESKLLTVATMPIEMKEFEEALTGINKDYFRGTVTYRNPFGRDGGTVRMVTKLGDISEYLVFVSGKDANEKWPQAILRLRPVFDQFALWNRKLLDIEKTNAKKKSEEQAGADQTATKPADKPPAKDQPSTPTSKDAPR